MAVDPPFKRSVSTSTGVPINNCILAYLVAHMAHRPKEQIKTVLLVNVTKDEILNVKKVIWETFQSKLDKLVQRVYTSVRGSDCANADDIINIRSALLSLSNALFLLALNKLLRPLLAQYWIYLPNYRVSHINRVVSLESLNHCRWISMSSFSIMSQVASNIGSISPLFVFFFPGCVAFHFLESIICDDHNIGRWHIAHLSLPILCQPPVLVYPLCPNSSSTPYYPGYSCLCALQASVFPSIKCLPVSSSSIACSIYITVSLSSVEMWPAVSFPFRIFFCQAVVWCKKSFTLVPYSCSSSPTSRSPVSPPFSSKPCPVMVLVMPSNISLSSACSLTKNYPLHRLQIQVKLPPLSLPKQRHLEMSYWIPLLVKHP